MSEEVSSVGVEHLLSAAALCLVYNGAWDVQSDGQVMVQGVPGAQGAWSSTCLWSQKLSCTLLCTNSGKDKVVPVVGEVQDTPLASP